MSGRLPADWRRLETATASPLPDRPRRLQLTPGRPRMKTHTDYLTLNIPSKMAFRNITPEVQAAVTKSGIQEGLVLVNTMHITASVFINDDEPGLHHDF